MRSVVPRRLAALLALGLLVLLPGTGRLPLLDRDEPRFSRATVEMIERGEWVVPYFNDEYRFDKPVLTYWLMRGGYALFGRQEFGARFHSIVSALLLAGLVYTMGRRWMGDRAGFAAAAALLMTMQFLIHGRSAVADMPMVLCVAAAEFALYQLLAGEATAPRGRWLVLLYGALGLGFLAKGPIAWLVPLLSLVFFRWVFLRKPLPWRRLRAGWGILAVLAIIAPWGLLALARTKGAFWDVGMGHHVIRRGFEAFGGRRVIPLYYLPSSLFSLFPWAAFFGFAWYAVRRNWTPLNAFLCAWLAAPYLVFTFYSTQLPHYVMPAYPAFLLILAQADPAAVSATRRWPRVAAAIVFGLFLLAAVLAAVCAAILPADGPVAGLRPALVGMAGLLLALVLAGTLFYRRAPVRLAAAAVLAAGSMALMASGFRAVNPSVQLGELMRAMPAGSEFQGCRFREPSLVFYSGRTWDVTGDPRDAVPFSQRPGPRMIILTDREQKLDALLLDVLAARLGRAPRGKAKEYAAENDALGLEGFAMHRIEGLNVASSKWVTLRVLVRLGEAPSE